MKDETHADHRGRVSKPQWAPDLTLEQWQALLVKYKIGATQRMQEHDRK